MASCQLKLWSAVTPFQPRYLGLSATWVQRVPVSRSPTTMPWPVKPSAQTDGALTFSTPHSTVFGTLGLLGVISKLATSGSSIQRAGLLESMRATSARAASDSARERSTVATIIFAAQNDW